MTTRWTAAPVPPAAGALRASGHLSPIAELLAQRGIDSPAAAAEFLAPARQLLSVATELPGFAAAAARLSAAAAAGERLLVVGDYDVDGVAATALLAATLEALGASVGTVLPRRDGEGYGLQPLHVDRALADGARLLVAVDSGTSAFAAWRRAAEAGVELLVVDHHLPSTPALELTSSVPIVVNPRLGAVTTPARELTAAGLAARLAAELFERAGREVPWAGLLRLAALGTIADVAPLVGDNRVLVALGLAALADTPSPGLRELMRSAATRPPLRATDVAFRIAPRLNAAGRLAHADLALELVLTRDPERARALAAELEHWNAERQVIERRILDEARSQLARRGELPALLVLSSASWHRGVVGVAAARLARELHRPTILLAQEGSEATGSGRSVAGLGLHELLAPWSGELARFGGHAQAVGMTVAVDRLPDLRAAWEEAAASAWGERLARRELRYDLELPLAAIDSALADRLAALEPFGAGNPEPTFRIGPCRLAGSPETFGRGHLRFAVAGVTEPARRRGVVAWNAAERFGAGLPAELELLVNVERDRYEGVRLRLVDLRGFPSTTD